MYKRSLEYMLAYALAMIKNDPEASVIFVTATHTRAKFVLAVAARLVAQDGRYMPDTRNLQFRYIGGGVLKVLPTDCDLARYGGIICTHMWLDDDLSDEARTWMPTRMRSSKDHPEPPGVYDAYGVVRRVDY